MDGIQDKIIQCEWERGNITIRWHHIFISGIWRWLRSCLSCCSNRRVVPACSCISSPLFWPYCASSRSPNCPRSVVFEDIRRSAGAPLPEKLKFKNKLTNAKISPTFSLKSRVGSSIALFFIFSTSFLSSKSCQGSRSALIMSAIMYSQLSQSSFRPSSSWLCVAIGAKRTVPLNLVFCLGVRMAPLLSKKRRAMPKSTWKIERKLILIKKVVNK